MLSEKEAQLANATREISRLEGEVESLRMEVVTAKSQADKVVNKGEAAAKDAQSKAQAMEELSAAHSSAQEEIRQLTEQLSAFEALQQENAELKTRLLESDTNLRVLQEKLRQTEGDEHTRNAQFAKDKAAMAADKRKIQELEQQVVTLSDSLEMLTLDKEQLAVDKEILEDNIAVRAWLWQQLLPRRLLCTPAPSLTIAIKFSGAGDGVGHIEAAARSGRGECRRIQRPRAFRAERAAQGGTAASPRHHVTGT
jgi:chromosome segregation ATPase